MRGRIVAVDAAAEHRDRRTTCVERAAVRLRVDAARHAGDDDEAGARELAAERPPDRRAVAGARPRSHDRHCGTREQLELRLAAHEETCRRIVNRLQQRREPVRGAGDEAIAARCELLLVSGGVESAQVRRPASPVRRPEQVRSGLRRENRECELRHAASSCGDR